MVTLILHQNHQRERMIIQEGEIVAQRILCHVVVIGHLIAHSNPSYLFPLRVKTRVVLLGIGKVVIQR